MSRFELDNYLVRSVGDKEEYLEFKNRESTIARLSLERSALPSLIKAKKSLGWCGVCREWQFLLLLDRHVVQKDNDFSVKFSETFICSKCGANSRMRAATDFVFMLLGRDGQQGEVYLTEHKTKLYAAYKKKLNVLGSEYLAAIKPGHFDSEGTRCEDLTKLTFLDDKFDMVVSFDVLEHVNCYRSALHQIRRVLKPGCYAVITFPFYGLMDQSRQRAAVEDGKVVHLRSPVYHGNPISGEGALVFYDFGWDVVTFARETFEKCSMLYYSSFLGLHFGLDRCLLVLKK